MIYLDNNATTPLTPRVLERMNDVATSAFANPGSRHAAGRQARQVLESARETMARILNADPEEIIFTSGGTEASNLAIFGLTSGHESGTIALPPGEHPATEEPVKRLTKLRIDSTSFKRFKIPITTSGRINIEPLTSSASENVRLVTALLAHNETGTIQDLQPLSSWCQEHRVPFHVDAVQAVGKVEINFRDSEWTSMSLAAHKFNGPRGIGALVIRKGCRLIPQQLGGHQERGLRAGTELVTLAAGMATALEEWNDLRSEREQHLLKLRNRLETALLEQCAPAIVNGAPDSRLATTLNIAFPGCDADALLVALDLAGVCCSHGSACASGSSEPAPILVAMNCPEAVQRSAIRLSLGIQNTELEIETAIKQITSVVTRLRQK